MPAIITMPSWAGLGYNMLVFTAGLKAIPRDIHDAALVDGANRWQQFWRVTLPLLSPTLFFGVVLTLITSFQVFTQPYVLTAGGPATCPRSSTRSPRSWFRRATGGAFRLRGVRRAEWWPWAERDHLLQAPLRIYTDLFRLHQKQQRLGEAYEVVIALGHLAWRSPSGSTVRRHPLVAQTMSTSMPTVA